MKVRIEYLDPDCTTDELQIHEDFRKVSQVSSVNVTSKRMAPMPANRRLPYKHSRSHAETTAQTCNRADVRVWARSSVYTTHLSEADE